MENVHRPEEPEDWKDLIDELSLNTIEILFIPEEVIARETISRYFDDVFHGQINSLTQGCDEDTVLSLKSAEKEIRFFFVKISVRNLQMKLVFLIRLFISTIRFLSMNCQNTMI